MKEHNNESTMRGNRQIRTMNIIIVLLVLIGLGFLYTLLVLLL